MSFDDFFREDRPNKTLQVPPSRVVADLARRMGWAAATGAGLATIATNASAAYGNGN